MAFLNKKSRERELEELLKNIGKNNPNQYWNMVEKFGLLENDHIRAFSEEICITLIRNHKNIELEKKILEVLYGDSSISYYRKQIIDYCECKQLKAINNGGYLAERNSFADIGATILENFHIKKPDNLLGTPIKEVL